MRAAGTVMLGVGALIAIAVDLIALSAVATEFGTGWAAAMLFTGIGLMVGPFFVGLGGWFILGIGLMIAGTLMRGDPL